MNLAFRVFWWLQRLGLCLFLVVILVPSLPAVHGGGLLQCDPSNQISGDTFCFRTIGKGSTCHVTRHVCTNPFARKQGCLGRMVEHNAHSRVCNSQDTNTTTTITDTGGTNCTPPPTVYSEIRIHPGSSDSSLILAWIYQILLMERLQVPVVIDNAAPAVGGSSDEWNFYQPFSSFPATTDFPNGVAWSTAEIDTVEEFDVVPLISRQAANTDYFETIATGLWGQTNLYIPQITARRYPALVSVYGLQQSTPDELANIFQQPYTWSQYCQTISVTKCQQPDAVAKRLPTTPQEAFCYHHDTAFTGYFGTTTTTTTTSHVDDDGVQNHHNTTTTIEEEEQQIMGHVISPSCELETSSLSSINFEAQLYWNNITTLQSQGPLKPNGGYELEHMIQIWKAANATQSNVLMWWWTPDSLVEAFSNTQYAFVPIQMPESFTTQQCLLDHHRNISTTKRCSLNQQDRWGSDPRSVGYCGTPPEGEEMRKAIAISLKEQPLQTDPVDRSPAYDTIKNLRISNHDLKAILKQWGEARYNNQQEQQQSDDDDQLLGYQTREAVCVYVTEHLEELESSFPVGYPRIVLQSSDWTNAAYLTAAQTIGGIAAVVIMLTGVATVHWKRRSAVVYAQVHFVWQVLLGLWFVSMASILYGKEPSDSRCLLAQWLSTLGYTFVLVPLVVKIATINHIAQTLRKGLPPHHRGGGGSTTTADAGGTGTLIRISPIKMFLVEMGLSICVIMYLMIWTAYDPPSRMETQQLTGEDGNIVETTIRCSSESDGFIIAVLCWEGVLLVCATVLAILTEQVVEDFKESRALGQMVYCQDLFLVLRVVLFSQRGSIQASVYSATLSFFLSTNALLSAAIYFGPLFTRMASGNENDDDCVVVPRTPPLHPQTITTTSTHTPGEPIMPTTQQEQQQQQQPTLPNRCPPNLGMGSASSADLSILIQNRLREAAGHFAEDGGFDHPITAECSRSGTFIQGVNEGND